MHRERALCLGVPERPVLLAQSVHSFSGVPESPFFGLRESIFRIQRIRFSYSESPFVVFRESIFRIQRVQFRNSEKRGSTYAFAKHSLISSGLRHSESPFSHSNDRFVFAPRPWKKMV